MTVPFLVGKDAHYSTPRVSVVLFTLPSLLSYGAALVEAMINSLKTAYEVHDYAKVQCHRVLFNLPENRRGKLLIKDHQRELSKLAMALKQ